MTRIIKFLGAAFCTVFLLGFCVVGAHAAEGGGSPNMFASSLKAMGALMLVLAIILLVAWLAKRYLHVIPQGMARGDSIKVVAVKAIGPKRAVHLLEVEGHKILIGSTEGGVTLLKELESVTGQKN